MSSKDHGKRPVADAGVSLRDRQKEMRRANILGAAQRLFGEHGFSGTSMENIADEAGVGVATVYKYFGSKNGVLQGLFEPEFERISREVDLLLQKLPERPADGVLAMFERYRITPFWADRDLLRPLAVDYLAATNRYTVFQEFEPMLRGHVSQILRAYQQLGKVDPNLDCNLAADLVLALMLLGFHGYISHPDVTLADLRREYDTRIHLLFADWHAR